MQIVQRGKETFISDILDCDVDHIICPLDKWYIRYKTDQEIGVTLLHIDGRKIRRNPEKQYYKDNFGILPDDWMNFWMMLRIADEAKHRFFIVDPQGTHDVVTQRRTFALANDNDYASLKGYTNPGPWKIGDVLWWNSNTVPHSIAHSRKTRMITTRKSRRWIFGVHARLICYDRNSHASVYILSRVYFIYIKYYEYTSHTLQYYTNPTIKDSNTRTTYEILQKDDESVCSSNLQMMTSKNKLLRGVIQ